MSIEIHGTGVLIRAATDQEAAAVERARRPGGEFELVPPRNFSFSQPYARPRDDEIVSVAFVDFTDDGVRERWTGSEQHGHYVTTTRDASKDLLALAHDTEVDGLLEMLTDMRIQRLPVTRWQFMSAPRRYELDPDLQARLAPQR